MKKYLESLKKELLKLRISEQEIEEILKDHEEMISEALAEGLSETEIVEKFGQPEKVAQDIADSNQTEEAETGNKRDMTLWKTMNVENGIVKTIVSLVSEDISYESANTNSITIYYKGDEDLSLYELSFISGELVFKRRSNFTNNFFSFRSRDMHFIVVFPQKIEIGEFKHNSVSGDIDIKSITSKAIEVSSTSGDLSVTKIVAQTGKMSLVSGDLHLDHCIIERLSINTVSGDMNVNNLVVNDEFRIDGVSGDVKINNSITKMTAFKTVSGDLDGTEFYPESIALSSVSGDINICNQDQSKAIRVLKSNTLSGTIQINHNRQHKD
ncbi:MAG: DUF4097 family beta strand repeat-containing protein [Candidatus Izemoplasmatales bacterium]|nr:DUF4097 family beta strand repeat-containing protein [Candidatus Izemoplasmatales bacterium]